MSNSVRPHRRKPTRLLCPWDSPGKNTGVGCHFLLQCMKVKSESEVTQSRQTLRDPMDCSLPGSSIHGIFQARVQQCELAIIIHTSPPSLASLNPTLQVITEHQTFVLNYETLLCFRNNNDTYTNYDIPLYSCYLSYRDNNTFLLFFQHCNIVIFSFFLFF